MNKGAFALWLLAASVAVAVALNLYGRPGDRLDAKPVPDVVRFGRSLELCTQEASVAMKELSIELRFAEREWRVNGDAWATRDQSGRAAAAEWASTCLLRLNPVEVLDARTGRRLATYSSARGYRDER